MDIKQCPFCECQNTHLMPDNRVECFGCGAIGPAGDGITYEQRQRAAVLMWNTPVSPKEMANMLEKH